MRSRNLVGSVRVAGGILFSRIFGLLRESTVAFVFGVGPHADVFSAVMRAPNLLQNLLGEQTLSSSFIPVYSRMLEEGRERDAGRLAGAMFGFLLALTAFLALVGVWLAPQIVTLMMPGFLADAARVAEGTASVDRFPLAVTGVRIIFPMTGLLVLSAWALGILNSHRRFFLPYFAPVLWNAAIIAGLLGGYLWLGGGAGLLDGPALDRLLILVCLSALGGGLLQFLAQVPLVLRLSEGLRVSVSRQVAGVAQTFKALLPMLGARGAAQLSSWLDQVLASLLATGALVGLRYGSILYLLPFALFGASVAAAELPELARGRQSSDAAAIAERTRASLRQIAFLVVPTVVGYLAFGFLIVGAVYRRGSFELEANWLVYLILAGYSVGLLASSWSRMLQNLYYAHGNTRVPATTAVVRMLFSPALGLALMFWLDRYSVTALEPASDLGGVLRLGGVGLAIASGVAAWLELGLLRKRARGRLPDFRLPWAAAARMLGVALIALVPAAGLWWATRELTPLLGAPLVVGLFAAIYLGAARLLGWPELGAWLGRVKT